MVIMLIKIHRAHIYLYIHKAIPFGFTTPIFRPKQRTQTKGY